MLVQKLRVSFLKQPQIFQTWAKVSAPYRPQPVSYTHLIAGKLAESYWDNNSTDILAIVDGSFLMDYDDAGQELQFKSAAAISIMYTILERCGFEPEGYFDRDDFQAIYDFSTLDAV